MDAQEVVSSNNSTIHFQNTSMNEPLTQKKIKEAQERVFQNTLSSPQSNTHQAELNRVEKSSFFSSSISENSFTYFEERLENIRQQAHEIYKDHRFLFINELIKSEKYSQEFYDLLIFMLQGECNFSRATEEILKILPKNSMKK